MLIGWVLMCFAALHCGAEAVAADVQMVWGTAYDSNLYEVATGAQGGFASRFFATVDALPFRSDRAAIKLQQQAGVKRLWTKAPGQQTPGDVLVYHLEVAGQRRLGVRATVSGGGQVKFKQATRVPGEESYARVGLFAQVQARVSRALIAGAGARAGADDSRDALLPEVDYREWNAELRYAKSRRLTGRIHASWRRLDYDRQALVNIGDYFVTPAGYAQRDRLHTLGIEGQAYPGMLVQIAYWYMVNHSNSFGYGYRAHRFQGMAVRHIGMNVDAQVFAQFQFRKYRETLSTAFGRASEVDEYEQTLGIFKLSRHLTAQYGVSLQYAFSRNGARQSDAFYRKHLYSLTFEARL